MISKLWHDSRCLETQPSWLGTWLGLCDPRLNSSRYVRGFRTQLLSLATRPKWLANSPVYWDSIWRPPPSPTAMPGKSWYFTIIVEGKIGNERISQLFFNTDFDQAIIYKVGFLPAKTRTCQCSRSQRHKRYLSTWNKILAFFTTSQ